MDGLTLNYQEIKNMLPRNKPTHCDIFCRMFCLHPDNTVVIGIHCMWFTWGRLSIFQRALAMLSGEGMLYFILYRNSFSTKRVQLFRKCHRNRRNLKYRMQHIARISTNCRHYTVTLCYLYMLSWAV